MEDFDFFDDFNEEDSDYEVITSDILNITEFKYKYNCLAEVPEGWSNFEFPSHIQQIRPKAFDKCSNTLLTVLFVNSTLQHIRNEAFINCTRLKSINLEDCENLLSIGKRAFMNCYSLQTISFPSSLIAIKESSFENCRVLSMINFTKNSNLKIIGNFAFRSTHITTLEIPEFVYSIGIGSFSNSNLTTIKLHENNKNFKVIDYNILYTYNLSILILYATLNSAETITIHQNTEYICDYACNNAVYTKNVIFNQNLKIIGTEAFSNSNIQKYDFAKCKNLNIINDSAFMSNKKIQELDLSSASSLIKINSDAFFNCFSLTFVNFPKNLEEIGKSAFAHCMKLSKINIPNDSKLKLMDSFSFYDTLISSFYIPKHLVQIDVNFLRRSFYLSKIEVSKENTNYTSQNNVLYNKDMTILYVYPNQKTDEQFIIPKTVKIISKKSFINNHFIQKVNLPRNLQTIEDLSFFNTSLKTLSFPPNVKELGVRCFMLCQQLTDCYLQGDFLEIPSCFFMHCHELQTVVLPVSLLSLGENSFADCPRISCVKCPFAVRTLLTNMGVNPITFTRPCRIQPVIYQEL